MIIYDDDGIGHEVVLISALKDIKKTIEREEKWLLMTGYTMYNVDVSLDSIRATVEKYIKECE